jgi:hypothetical protein
MVRTMKNKPASVKQQLETLVCFAVPSDLVGVANAFVKRAGNFQAGMELLRDYLGMRQDISNTDSGRGYVATPIEFFPFLYTGDDGEMYGYVNAAPELNLPDLPMGDFFPGDSDGVRHVGNKTISAIENIISYMHFRNGFAEVDLGFLKTIGLSPSAKKSKNVRLVEGQARIRPMPSLPKGWEQVMTTDGVGVVAETSRFRPGPTKQWPLKVAIRNVLAEAEKDLSAGFTGSALYHLKEAWWRASWVVNLPEGKTLKTLKKRLIDVYEILGKDALADLSKRYLKWVKID